jgi:hypothetical protein
MSPHQSIEERLRAARPAGGTPPEFTTVLARIEASTKEPTRRRGRRRGVALALTLAAAVLLGAGGGALLLNSGRPVKPAFLLPANPRTGLGQPLASTLALLPTRVADPAGGPPWGMRVIRTTRDLSCLQGGRVFDGRLGGLGIGYAFKHDGRFHPFMPADAIDADSCVSANSRGLAFLPGGAKVVTADGLPLAGENLYPYQRVHCDLHGQEDWGVRCPQAELREVAMGLLGPDAESIHVTTPGHTFELTPYGEDGAYLIVLPAPARANTGEHGFLGRPAVGTPVLRVTYRDGSTCQIPAANRAEQCTPKGLLFKTPRIAVSHIHAALRVSYRLQTAPRVGPLFTSGSQSPPGITHSSKPVPTVVVSFRAPVSAPDASSGYAVLLRSIPKGGCRAAKEIVSQPTDSSISAGETLHIVIPVQAGCHITYRGRVFFIASSGRYGEGPLYEQVMSASRSRVSGLTIGRFQVSIP